MRLPPETRKRLDAELSQLKHMTLTERSIWHTCRTNGTVRRSDVRALIEEIEKMPAMNPTPAEAELIRLVRANL